MVAFTINDHIQIACEWRKTRNGFKHEAALLIDGSEVERAKVNYLNRTWEQYEYQSVIHKLLDRSKVLNAEQQAAVRAYMDGSDGYNGAGVRRDMAPLQMTGMVAALGNLLCGDDTKAKNDWKLRMIKAGLGDGLIMPDDWASLDEQTKQARLDKIIDLLKKGETA